MTVTRIEIADSVEEAFTTSPVAKHDLITAAAARRAHPGILDALARLPEQPYRSLVDLWPHLADVPVDL